MTVKGGSNGLHSTGDIASVNTNGSSICFATSTFKNTNNDNFPNIHYQQEVVTYMGICSVTDKSAIYRNR
jgi:hypothetical protein